MSFPLFSFVRRTLPLLVVLASVAGPLAAQERTADLAGGYVRPAAADSFWEPMQVGQGQQVQQNGAQPDPNAPLPAVEKSRKISRSFKASGGRPLTLETRYGRVQINTWSRSEIKAEVDIVARADEEEKAQQLLDMIQVLMQEQPGPEGGITMQTRLGEMPRECYSRQRLYEINYTIWVPKNTPLKVRNTFGDVSLTGDLTAPTELSVCYGNLRTARLEGSRNLVRVNNGAATVPYARHASLDATYSRLRLGEGQTVDLRNNGSDIEIGTVQELVVHSRYGDVSLGTVRSLQGSTGYSRFSIDKVSEQLDMKVQYCPAFEVRTTGRNFRRINVDGGYSTILLNFPDDAGFEFDVNSENGKVLMDKRLVKVRAEENSSSSTEVQGQYGAMSARNGGSVNIKTRYSSVSFNR
jgi:hypothetical protein